MPALLADDRLLVTLVLAVIGVEVALLLVGAVRRPGLARRMLPGAAAGLFLALALNELQRGGRWLALWLAAAGVAHLIDTLLRRRTTVG